MKHVLPAATALMMVAAPSALLAQRNSGTIGHYIPPRLWPQGVHDFDLVHQKIAVQFDEPTRLVTGAVTTTVVPDVATDTVRLNADHLTIDQATDASGRADRVLVRHRPRHGASPAARRRRATPSSSRWPTTPIPNAASTSCRAATWSGPRARRPRRGRWVPTYDFPNDKTTWEFLVTADSGLSVLSNGTLVGVTPVAGGKAECLALGARSSRPRPISTRSSSGRSPCSTTSGAACRWTTGSTPTPCDAGWRTFGETPSMIEIYSQVARRPLSLGQVRPVVIPDFTYGGMENVSATTQTDLVLHGAGGEPEDNGRGPRGARAGAPVVRRSRPPPPTGPTSGSTRGSPPTWSRCRTRRARGWEARPARVVGQQQQGDGCRSPPGAPAGLGRLRRAPIRSSSSSAGTSIPRVPRWRTSSAACSATRCSGRGCSAS